MFARCDSDRRARSGKAAADYGLQLLYIYILGWNVDFGHLEAVNLISANKYSEKQIGYLAMTLFLHEKHELLHLVVNSIRKDLLDHNELFNCLALHAIANVGGREMGEALSEEVHRLLISPCVAIQAKLSRIGLMKSQDVQSIRQEEGGPHTSPTLPKIPRHHPASVGRTNHFSDGRPGFGCCPVCYFSCDGPGPGQPRPVQGSLCESYRETEEDTHRRRLCGGLPLLQGPLSLDPSQAPEIAAVLPSITFVALFPYNSLAILAKC